MAFRSWPPSLDVSVQDETQVEIVREEAPILSHLAWMQDPRTALCGKRLIGVAAPDSAPRCIVCEEWWESRTSW